jgi:hypothetical protein
VADVESPHYQRLAELVAATFPGALVVPFMMTGATDSRHYASVCQNAMRFSPYFLTQEEIQTVHAVNERLSFVNAGRMVAFYEELIRQESSLLEEDEQAKAEEISAPRQTVQITRKERAKRVVQEIDEIPAEAEALPDDDEPLVVKSLRKDK